MATRTENIDVKIKVDAKASQAELDRLNARLEKSRRATKNVKSASLDLKNVLKAGLGFAGLSVGIGTVVKGFNDVIGATNQLGDKWEQFMGGMSASYDAFMTSIAQGDWSNLFDNMETANELGREYIALMDSIFELTLSNKLNTAKYSKELADYGKIYKDTSQLETDRLDALEKAEALEKRLADERKVTAKTTYDAAVINLKATSKMSAAEIEAFIEFQAHNKDKIKQAQEYVDALEKSNQSIVINYRVDSDIRKKYVQGIKDAQDKVSSFREKFSDDEIKNFERLIAEQKKYQLNTNDEKVKALIEGRIEVYKSEAEISKIEERYARYRGSINNALHKNKKENAKKTKIEISEIAEEEEEDFEWMLSKKVDASKNANAEILDDIMSTAEQAEKIKQKELEAERILEEQKRRLKQQTADIEMQMLDGVGTALQLAKDKELQDAEGNEKKLKKIRKDYALLEAGLALTKIAISTATAVAELTASVVGAPLIPGVIASGAIQAGVVVAQQAAIQSMATGGIIEGNSHANGGVLINAEGEEAIINKNSMRIPALKSLASAINVAGGGVPFSNIAPSANSSNDILNATIDKSTINEIVQQVSSIPVIVVESEITEKQRKVRVIETKTTF